MAQPLVPQVPAVPQVVVGVDGSESSGHAARWAAEVAFWESIPLRLVHAVSLPHFVAASGFAVDGSLIESIEAQGQEILDQCQNELQERYPTLQIDTQARTMSPAQALVEASEHARLVVLGSTGKSPLTGALIGSTAVSLSHRAHCPVAVIRGAKPSGPPPTAGPVVLGVAGLKTEELAISVAFEEASWRGVELVVVHAWMEGLADSSSVAAYPLLVDWDVLEKRERLALSTLLAGWREKYPDVQVRTEVVRDRPNHALIERAAGAQALVIGSRGRGELAATLLGSTAQAMIYHAPCPVIVARGRQ